MTTSGIDLMLADAEELLRSRFVRRTARATGWGVGSDRIGLFPERPLDEELAEVAAARAFRRLLFDVGLGWPTGPPQFGGRGLPRPADRRLAELIGRYDTPSTWPFDVTYGMVAPTIAVHGTEAARSEFLPGLYSGDLIACQLFSEPGAGSDLAAVATRVVPVAGGWRVSGQKVWTSAAHHSDVGLLLARTSTKDERHAGLSVFVVRMRQEGVTVRPLRQMTGGASFNEVFFDDAFVEEAHLLGELGGGWAVARTTLMHEREAVGTGVSGAAKGTVGRLFDLAARLDRASDPVVRQALARVYTAQQLSKYNIQRAAAASRAGRAPGPEGSLGKLAMTVTSMLVAETVSSVLGPRLAADDGTWGTFAWAEYLCGVPGTRLAGGTDEVQRNILAERVLGMPRLP